MKFKKGLIATVVVLALAVPATAFAATSTSSAAIKIRGLFGIDSSKLTTAQMADVTDYAKKAAELQKSLLDKMVKNGSMTQAQADTQKAQIDSNLANGDVFVGGGRGMGTGMRGGPGMDGNMQGGMRGGIDASKLTDEQKKSLLTIEKEQLTLEKNLAGILVEQKLITQAQSDAINKNVDAAIAALTTSNLSHGMMKGGMGRLDMLEGMTLTDAQKTALLEWAKSSAAVEKKSITLFKDAGLITQAQADAMNTQIDARAADPLSFTGKGNGKMGGNMMGGRHGGFGGPGGAPDSGAAQTGGTNSGSAQTGSTTNTAGSI